jgi:hypothetical protein
VERRTAGRHPRGRCLRRFNKEFVTFVTCLEFTIVWT